MADVGIDTSIPATGLPSYMQGTLAPGGALPTAGSGAAGDINAATLMSPLDVVHQAVGQSQEDLSRSRENVTRGQLNITQGASLTAQGTVNSAIADRQRLLEQQQNDQVVYAMFGTTPGHPSALVADIASRISASEQQITIDRDKLNKKLSIDPLNNPFSWLLGQITAPFDVEALNNKIAGRNDDFDVLHRLAEATREETAQNAAASYVPTSLKLDAVNQIASGKAQTDAGESALRAAQITVGMAGTGASIGSTDYSAAASQYHSVLDTERLRLAQASGGREDVQLTYAGQANERAAESLLLQKQESARQEEMFKTNLAINKLNLQNIPEEMRMKQQTSLLQKHASELADEELSLRKQGLSMQADELKIREQSLQLQIKENQRREQIFPTELGNQQVLALNNQDKLVARQDMDARVQKLGALGFNLKSYDEFLQMADGKEKEMLKTLLWNPDIQQGLAYSLVGPAQAVQLVNNLRPALTPGQDILRKQLTADRETALGQISLLAKTYTPEQLDGEINKRMAIMRDQELARIPDTGGKFSPPSLATTLALPGMKDNPLVPLLAPLAAASINADGNYPTRAEDVIAAMGVAIKNKQLNPAQAAAAVSSFYNTVNQADDAAHGYRLFAVRSPLVMGSFNAVVPSPTAAFGGMTSVNLANRAVMENYFKRLEVREVMQPPIGAGVTP